MRCPECGKILVKRLGKDKEEKMVCSGFPFCKYGAKEVHTYICEKCFHFDCICEEKKEVLRLEGGGNDR